MPSLRYSAYFSNERDLRGAAGLSHTRTMQILDAINEAKCATIRLNDILHEAQKEAHTFDAYVKDCGQWDEVTNMCLFCGEFKRSEICIEKEIFLNEKYNEHE